MPQEREPYHELDPNLIAAYSAIFIPRTDVYPLQLEDGRYISIKRTLYPDLVVAHLKGFITIGAYALNTENKAKWLCFDADDEDLWHKLNQLSDSLAERDVPSYLELSRRGGHLWLFFSPLSGSDTRRFGKQLLADHEIEPLELYPKQNELTTGTGSFVRLPLGKHRLTGRRYHFITRTGEPLAPTVREQLAILARPQHIPQPFIDDVLSRAPEAKQVSPTPPFQERKPSKKRQISTREQPSERIKAAVGVLEFVSRYVELDSQGRGFCPFHPDEHKSFAVSQDGNYWHCFAGCGGGSIIDFWMKWREKQGDDGSFTATVTDLANQLLD
ncbi:MAG: hypothetical protein GC204_13685 [Chloroflexi bacterium]|nr:hypothetical protein [Chloroflexota bacterium]